LLELLRDYDVSILYSPDKENVVADSLSSKSMSSLTEVDTENIEMVKALNQLSNIPIQLLDTEDGCVVVENTTASSLLEEAKQRHYEDAELVFLRDNILQEKYSIFDCALDRVLRY